MCSSTTGESHAGPAKAQEVNVACKWHSVRSAYLHLPVVIDVQEALPELDNLQGHKQGDGDQVGVQNPKGDHEDNPVDSTTLVVTLYMQISILADSITSDSTCKS